MPSSRQRRDSVRFSETVAPNGSETLRYELPDDATVEEVSVRIYVGAELDLEIKPFVDRDKGNDRTQREPLIEYRGREYVAGDDDKFVFPISVDVEEGQELAVEAINTDGTYPLDFSVDMTLEYAGGLKRVLGGVF